jgi:hypothetical protein
MCHPWNKDFGKGAMTDQCGFVCLVWLDKGLDEEADKVIFFDREHGMCELHTPRVNQKVVSL